MIFIGFLLIILFLIFYKFMAVSIVKITAFFIDFLLVIYYTSRYFHDAISIKISRGVAVYFWDVVIVVVAMVIYGFLIILINKLSSIASKIINFIISYLGAGVAVAFSIEFLTALLSLVTNTVKETRHIQLLNNQGADEILYLIIYFLIAIPIWKIRMSKLDELAGRNV